jgi:2-polyprenyl-3-methyl-5-hydroxy-6-metoxy-1,4-benzoquinol methylase
VREFSPEAFETAYDAVIQGHWQETPEYYSRYASRYRAVVRRYAEVAPHDPLRVLEIGGGQLALLVSQMFGDSAVVADVNPECFGTLADHGVSAFLWNAASDEPPSNGEFDVILCSEVIEHLPVPGHVFLARLRKLLRPNGTLILTTPNLYRLRNVIFLATGRVIYDHFDTPNDAPCGHVLEYSEEHLAWQLNRAGFEASVELVEFHHTPKRRSDAVLSALGRPLRAVPRFRDNLLVVASPRAASATDREAKT